MKGKILAIIFLFNFTSFLSLNAQWARTYGGSEDDCAYSIQQTSDGGYIVAGYTKSFGAGSGDIWILKLSSVGDIEWQKTYGKALYDGAHSIQPTNDGRYIVGGSTSFLRWGPDIWVLKLASSGDSEWQKYHGVGYAPEETHSIQPTNDGGYIVAGEIYYWEMPKHDIFVYKLSLDGDIEWNKAYGGALLDGAYSIQPASDGGYIVAGQTESFGAGSSDIWILKLNSGGDIEWQKTYGGALLDGAYSIQPTNDGGYIVAGETSSFGAGNVDILVLKLASNGTIEWQKTYGGYNEDEASSIKQTIDGGYIVAGFTDSYGAGKRDFLILKLSSNGDIDPACRFVKESNAEVSDADIIPSNTDITPEDTNIRPGDTNITPQESEAVVYELCSGEHTLSLSAGSGGTTVPQPGTYIYDHAARISISADPDDGYNFSEWSGNASGTDNPKSITMDSDRSINANFSIIVIEDIWEEVKKTPCFIATAAYGSPHHPYVDILREFKDKYLMSNKLGREFVELYYEYSPFASNLIAKHKVLKVIAQMNLFPFVVFSYSMIYFGPTATSGILLIIIMIPIFPYFRRNHGE